MHLSKLIERVERGEQITIARNNRPVVVMSSVVTSPKDILARIDAVRERIRERNGGRAVLQPGETWRDLVEEGRRAQ
jgi:antitoxin (DNA-binding transcriptional repressor) of toxin-antitoxin stability system